MIKILIVLLSCALLWGCPPVSYVDIYNASASSIYVVAPSKLIEIPSNKNVTFVFDEIATYEERESGKYYPTLQFKTIDRSLYFDYFVWPSGEYIEKDGSVYTLHVQLDSEYSLYVAKPGEHVSIVSSDSQPNGFPIKPKMKK